MKNMRKPTCKAIKKHGKSSFGLKLRRFRYCLKSKSFHASITTTDEAPLTRRPSDDTQKTKEKSK